MHPRPPEDDDQQIIQKMLGYYDAPAFVRRVKRLEDAERIMHEHLAAKRLENLAMVRLRIGQLRALAGDWPALRPLLGDDAALAVLGSLHAELQPVLRLALDPTRSVYVLRGALGDLVYAMGVFNQRWQKYLIEFDLTMINELRDGYNRNYLIEKECAMRNSGVARLGLQRLAPLSTADLLQRFPLLPLPRLAG